MARLTWCLFLTRKGQVCLILGFCCVIFRNGVGVIIFLSRRGREVSVVRHATDVTETVFHVHTDTLLLRVTALLLRVIAPITPCNSPTTPSLGPPRLGPAVRSRTTEYPKMVFDHSNSLKSEVLPMLYSFPQTLSWPGCL